MRSSNTSNKLAPRQIIEGPCKKAAIAEQITFEIGRLTIILRNPVTTEEEQSITQSQIGDYQEIVVITDGTHEDWLQQMCLLADPGEDKLV